MSGTFVALDVETANADLASICQVGVVSFIGGEIVDSWQSLVDPDDWFDEVNVSIHGIDETTVRMAPSFPEIAPLLASRLTGKVVATHMSFDRVAIGRAIEKHSLSPIDCTWLDTARVVRRAWPQFASSGYGLEAIAAWCGVNFRHHIAEDDARAAGLVLLRAISDSGLGVSDWVLRSVRPLGGSESGSHARTGAADGHLAGEVVVFTGALSLPRREAADLAAAAGCNVGVSVGSKTTLLVVGNQDARKLAGHTRSSKHRTAERLIQGGQRIRILTERDFRTIVQARE